MGVPRKCLGAPNLLEKKDQGLEKSNSARSNYLFLEHSIHSPSSRCRSQWLSELLLYFFRLELMLSEGVQEF